MREKSKVIKKLKKRKGAPPEHKKPQRSLGRSVGAMATSLKISVLYYMPYPIDN